MGRRIKPRVSRRTSGQLLGCSLSPVSEQRVDKHWTVYPLMKNQRQFRSRGKSRRLTPFTDSTKVLILLCPSQSMHMPECPSRIKQS